jgi:hypothetical protein
VPPPEVELVRKPYQNAKLVRPGAGQLNAWTLPERQLTVAHKLNKSYAIDVEVVPAGQRCQPNMLRGRPMASGGGRILSVCGTVVQGTTIAIAGYSVGRTYSSQAPLVYDPNTGTWGTLDDYYLQSFTSFWSDYYTRDELNWNLYWDRYYHQKWQRLDGLNGGPK